MAVRETAPMFIRRRTVGQLRAIPSRRKDRRTGKRECDSRLLCINKWVNLGSNIQLGPLCENRLFYIFVSRHLALRSLSPQSRLPCRLYPHHFR